ncbi:MAG: radical SAM family heme chaperone HemW [bacterium]
MLGIYIHIPFCVRKCDYCDFYSIPVEPGLAPQEQYLQAVIAQLELDVEALRLEGRQVTSVYFGGGTPSIMKAEFFSSLLNALSRHFKFSADVEVSCEVNPATADARWFRNARSSGITRCSIGVQSFQERLLRGLGRIHTADDAMRAIAEAQDAGFDSVGMDLMYAMPGETMGELEEDVRTAMTFQPNHISAYQLTIEEGTPMHEKYISGPGTGNLEPGKDNPGPRSLVPGPDVDSEDDQLQQMRTVGRMLGRSGWPRYEISNFAKPGFECRHNLNYWRYGEYLGLGAGATSFVLKKTCDRAIVRSCVSTTERVASCEPEIFNDRTNAPTHQRTIFARRWTQARDVNAYIEGSADLAESEELDARTAMGEYCFLGLRTTEGISAATFEGLFHESFEAVFGGVCESLKKDGLILRTIDRIALTQRGLELSNMVFEKFIS